MPAHSHLGDLATAPGTPITGSFEIEWPVKAFESAEYTLVTGLTTITAITGQLAGTYGYLTTISVVGGTVKWRALANAELAAGTKRTVYWIATGT